MKIKNRQQWLAILAGTAVLLLVADRVVLAGLSSSWKQRASRIEDLRKKVGEGRSLVLREASLRSRWEFMRTNALPQNPSLAEQQVLKGFDRWAQESRVTILSISPQWKRDADDYTTLDCRVEASGNLAAISRFIYEIEKDPMALRLQNIEIGARDNDGQQLALGLQVSGLVLARNQEQK